MLKGKYQFDDEVRVARCDLNMGEGKALAVDFLKEGSAVSTSRLEVNYDELGPGCIKRAVWDREAQKILTDKDDDCVADLESRTGN